MDQHKELSLKIDVKLLNSKNKRLSLCFHTMIAYLLDDKGKQIPSFLEYLKECHQQEIISKCVIADCADYLMEIYQTENFEADLEVDVSKAIKDFYNSEYISLLETRIDEASILLTHLGKSIGTSLEDALVAGRDL